MLFRLFRLQLFSPAFTMGILICITVMAMIDYMILYQMQNSAQNLLNLAYYVFHWKNSEAGTYTTTLLNCEQFSIVTLSLLMYTIVTLRDLYCGFAFIVSILPLWLIGLDFKKIRCSINKGQVMIKYRKVAKLTRLFARAHGSALFCFFFNNLLYYSTKFDKIVTYSLGAKVYHLQFILLFVVVYALGSSFSRKVMSKK